jgi:hypothetical protein
MELRLNDETAAMATLPTRGAPVIANAPLTSRPALAQIR